MTNNDHLLLEALEAFLLAEGFIVKSSDKHLSTLSIIEDFRPDLIILDIALGESDGRMICDQLKNTESTAHIPILMLTGLSHEEISKIDCLADGIIGKPFESNLLLFNIITP